ncbi:topless-related protein 2-like [Dorcoceras hygrometricum]|uniref:Topless-related protein 2-like n=1 Tax=Dorcoceras hygrometricum TaxID=472368 RepID=A0A2Z7AFS0_9LAMI|nr:topless-related protein 2-like [Dorcoceras hygrometricum]
MLAKRRHIYHTQSTSNLVYIKRHRIAYTQPTSTRVIQNDIVLSPAQEKSLIRTRDQIWTPRSYSNLKTTNRPTQIVNQTDPHSTSNSLARVRVLVRSPALIRVDMLTSMKTSSWLARWVEEKSSSSAESSRVEVQWVKRRNCSSADQVQRTRAVIECGAGYKHSDRVQIQSPAEYSIPR